MRREKEEGRGKGRRCWTERIKKWLGFTCVNIDVSCHSGCLKELRFVEG